MRSDSSSSRRKGSVETRGEFEIYISDVVVHPDTPYVHSLSI